MTISGPESLLERAFTDAVERADDADEITTRVLDGAYEQFCQIGIRRSTIQDVAHRAGVSRITVYRRFATKDELVEQVVRREFRRYFDQFLLDIQQARTVADRIVLGFASSLRAIRRNPLIGGLMAVEPDVLVPYLAGGDGRMLAAVQRFVAGQLRLEQRAGNVSAEVNVELVAELMARVSASFLLTPSHVVDPDDDEQMRALARQFLVPMLGQTSVSFPD
jgi:TetR/AcrR family transcriptional regulator, repressor for uid operon